MNARLNILYVLDSLCQASLKSGFKGYVDLVRLDLDKVIALVVPNDARGMVNAASTRKVWKAWTLLLSADYSSSFVPYIRY